MAFRLSSSGGDCFRTRLDIGVAQRIADSESCWWSSAGGWEADRAGRWTTHLSMSKRRAPRLALHRAYRLDVADFGTDTMRDVHPPAAMATSARPLGDDNWFGNGELETGAAIGHTPLFSWGAGHEEKETFAIRGGGTNAADADSQRRAARGGRPSAGSSRNRRLAGQDSGGWPWSQNRLSSATTGLLQRSAS
jgi:hypothetical protein